MLLRDMVLHVKNLQVSTGCCLGCRGDASQQGRQQRACRAPQSHPGRQTPTLGLPGQSLLRGRSRKHPDLEPEARRHQSAPAPAPRRHCSGGRCRATARSCPKARDHAAAGEPAPKRSQPRFFSRAKIQDKHHGLC